MRVPQIRIDQTFAQMGLDIYKGKLDIVHPSWIVKVKQKHPKVELEQTPGKLEIDYTLAKKDLNMQSNYELNKEAAAKGRKTALEGIARTAKDGDFLARIDIGGNRIAKIASEVELPGPKDYTYGVVPRHFAVKQDYQPEKWEGTLVPGEVDVQVPDSVPNLEVDLANVRTYVKQKEAIQIDVVGLNMDRKM